MRDKDVEMARRVASAVRDAGGRTYYVGGYVRDLILGHKSKDIDIEVHGIAVNRLEEILDTLGERLTMGASFNVMGLRHYGIDIAMPRATAATGRGHAALEDVVDPFVGKQEAARRRDFTMNALMQDVLTGEVLDFFGGREDMACGRIRHVDDASFVEDPLRVFRAAQFAARFGFAVADETSKLSSSVAVDALPEERVMGELEKALMKAESPCVFFGELKAMRQLSVWFPELEALLGVEQNVLYHPEGDVWDHTMQVTDEAARVKGEASEPLWFMLSALCHDFGKAVSSQESDGVVHAYGHAKSGLPLVESFLGRLTGETRLAKYVLNMVELHMETNQLARQDAKTKAYMKLFDRSVCPEDLLLLARADHLGRVGGDVTRKDLEAEHDKTEVVLREMLSTYRERMGRPHVTGKDLIEAGERPGPLFGDALAYARKLRLAGCTKDEQLRNTLGWIRSHRCPDA